MHFLIFIPGAKGQSPKLLEEAGLADLVAGCEFLDSVGPENSRGVLCAWRKPGAAVDFCFAPERQTWLPAVPTVEHELPAKRYWVGLSNEKPPRPAELARSYQSVGRKVPLGDGQEWLFPEARELTRDLILKDDGNWEFEIQRQHHAFWVEAHEWLQRLAPQEGTSTFSYNALMGFLLRGLRLNYRILPEVASHLKLFNTENVRAPLFTVIGLASELERRV